MPTSNSNSVVEMKVLSIPSSGLEQLQTISNEATAAKTAAANSATAAAGSATAAAGSATAAAGSATTAASRATDAQTSASSIGNSVTAAAASATTATTKATEAANSATASAGSATTATTIAGEAATSAGTANTKATEAGTSQTAAAGSATLAQNWANKAYNDEVTTGLYSARHWAKVAQLNSAGQGTGLNALIFRGPWDASGGNPPATPTPETADFFKITVAGTIGGVDYGVGDNIVWDTDGDVWFKIDNSERPISDDLDLNSSVTSASSRAVKLLEDKKANNHPHPYRADTWVPTWSDVTGKPATFPPESHPHTVANITGLQTALDGKANTHPHPYRAETWVPAWTDVTGKPAQATRWPTWAEVTGKPTSFAATSHTHTIASVTGLQAALDAKEPTVAADRKRKITISTADPSGGADGDIWIKYTA